MTRRVIPPEERLKAFDYWCENQSISSVSVKSRIKRATLARWKIEDKWDKRFKEIKEEAQVIADAKSRKRLVENLKILKYAKGKIVQGIKNKEIKGNVSDIPNLIKTEELLVGNPDARVETQTKLKTKEEAETEFRELATVLGYEISRNHRKPPGRISPPVAGNPPSPNDKK